MLVTSDSKGMSILPTLRELTHMFGILQAPSGSAAVVATMVWKARMSSSSLGGMEPPPKKAYFGTPLGVSSWYVCGAACPLCGFSCPPLAPPSLYLNSNIDFWMVGVMSRSCTLGTAGRQLRSNNLDTTDPSSSKMTGEPYTPY
jgi:hypothetical protein